MQVIFSEVPRLVLHTAVLEAMRKHLLTLNPDEHVSILVPNMHDASVDCVNRVLRPASYRIALNYQAGDLEPMRLILQTSDVLGDLAPLHAKTRVPFILFVYADAFRLANRDALEHGAGTHRLLQGFINGHA